MKDIKELMKGLIDVHVHAGPSVADRSVDSVQMLREAAKAGYRAFVVKDHYFPTMMSAKITEQYLNDSSGIRVFGGICLNNSVGGINLSAVDAAYGMGAKFIWMPTVSAKRHIEGHKGHFPGSGNMSVAENPIYYLKSDGELKEEAAAVVAFAAAHEELILATGHGSVEEIDALLHKGVELGVKKLFVNHPHFLIGADIAQIEKWAAMGAYIEINAGVFETIGAAGEVPLATLDRMLEVVPIEQIVLDSDFGQRVNGNPVERHERFISVLYHDLHMTEEMIELAAKKTPAMLLGI